ncbi:MAG: hypothetical protein ACE5IQ_03635 [Candidatus Methylomirabilales bacterium]
MKRCLRVCLPVVGIFLTACAAGHVSDGTYINEAKGFVVQLPRKAWTVDTGNEADLVLRHAERQAGMSIHATCGEIPPHRSLEVLSRHLFFGIKGKELLWQKHHAASPGESLESVLRGKLDGRAVRLHAYTVKGPECVYDLVLFAAPEDYAAVNGEFEALVRQFQLVGGGKP